MVIITLLATNLKGQDYAGPDATICPGKSVLIGGTGSGSLCYKWTPETGLDDPTSANPTASPVETITYTVEVTSEDLSFSTSDAVTVTVGGIKSMTVMPIKCCWEKGDPLKLEEFDIMTVPPGIKGDVTISPTTAPGVVFASGTRTISFEFMCTGGDPVTAQTDITIVDEDATLEASFERFNSEAIDRDVRKLENTFKKFGGDCDFEVVFDGGYNLSLGKMCCPEKSKCVQKKVTIEGSANASAGIQCDFPFAGIPWVAEAEVVAGIALNGSVMIEGEYNCEEIEICGSAEFGVQISGGVEVEVGNGFIGEANLLLKGGVTASGLEYCYPKNKFEWISGVCFDIKICGEVGLGSFWMAGFEKKLASICWPEPEP